MLPISDFVQAIGRGEPEPLEHKDALNLRHPLTSGRGGTRSEPRYGGMSGLSGTTPLSTSCLGTTAKVLSTASPKSATGTEWSVEKVHGTVGKSLGGLDVKTARWPMDHRRQRSRKTCSSSRKVLRPATSENDEFVRSLALGASEKFQYRAADGQELDGWLIYPYG